jgi:hypothetical protein
MGLFSEIKDWFTFVPVQGSGSKLPPPPMEETETNDIWMRLSVSRKGDNVSIEMHGLDQVNVCLASFLAKGVSYAQEKYNEYKQSPKDIEPIEEPKAESRTKRESQRPSKREIEEMRAWAKAYQAKSESK